MLGYLNKVLGLPCTTIDTTAYRRDVRVKMVKMLVYMNKMLGFENSTLKNQLYQGLDALLG